MIIKQKNYEGPFDLLLELIEKSKIDIEDIQISEITEQFIEAMNKMDIDVNQLADFITVATQLLLLKTKSLIYIEEEEEEFTKEDLINRLIEYKKFKEISEKLRGYEKNGRLYLSKLQEDLKDYQGEVEEEIIGDPDILSRIYSILIDRYLEIEENAFNVDDVLNREEYSVEGYIEKINGKLEFNKKTNFKSLLSDITNKDEVIVVFLSILEMSRDKYIQIYQEGQEIYINRMEDLDGEK